MAKTATSKRHVAPAPEFITVQIPRIGEQWPGEGGLYAGIGRAVDGMLSHVIVGPEAPERLDWKAAQKWAEKLKVDGRSDFTLPTRRDQALCFANVPEQFEKTWYWSGEPHASDAGYAWYQTFFNGGQYYAPKDVQLRARAVRRLVIS